MEKIIKNYKKLQKITKRLSFNKDIAKITNTNYKMNSKAVSSHISLKRPGLHIISFITLCIFIQ